MVEHNEPKERELDIPLALTEQLVELKRRVTHLETLEATSGSRLPRFAQENIPWLVSQWPLQGNARDMAGVADNHLTVNNAITGQTDEFAYYIFDGTSDYLDIPDNASISVTGALSAHGWVYYNNAASAIETIMSKWRAPNNTRSYRVIRDATGNMVFQLSSGGGAINNSVTSTLIVGAGIWVFWFVKYNPSTQIDIWLGINGATLEQDSETAAIIASIDDNGSKFTLGASQDSFSTVQEELTGRETRVALHDGLVADETIEILYDQGLKYLGI